MKSDSAIGDRNDYFNLKFCAKCPDCQTINEKKSRLNALNCTKCGKLFCYICNKSISGPEHYQGAKTMCHMESDHWNDLWARMSTITYRTGIGWAVVMVDLFRRHHAL